MFDGFIIIKIISINAKIQPMLTTYYKDYSLIGCVLYYK